MHNVGFEETYENRHPFYKSQSTTRAPACWRPNGHRVGLARAASHPLGLFYSDSASGKVAQIAVVQTSAGVLCRPNVILFSNVLSGLAADLMLVWTKQGYEQNLLLNQAPPPPESFGLSSATTQLQMWSAMDSCPTPQQQQSVVLPSGLVDHILIFSDSWMPVGSAFASTNLALMQPGQAASIRLVSPSDPHPMLTAKSLVTIVQVSVLTIDTSGAYR